MPPPASRLPRFPASPLPGFPASRLPASRLPASQLFCFPAFLLSGFLPPFLLPFLLPLLPLRPSFSSVCGLCRSLRFSVRFGWNGVGEVHARMPFGLCLPFFGGWLRGYPGFRPLSDGGCGKGSSAGPLMWAAARVRLSAGPGLWCEPRRGAYWRVGPRHGDGTAVHEKSAAPDVESGAFALCFAGLGLAQTVIISFSLRSRTPSSSLVNFSSSFCVCVSPSFDSSSGMPSF